MFDGANQQGSLVDERVESFSPTVTLLDVSVRAVSMRITVVDLNGFPLEVLEGVPGVVADQTTVVDLTQFERTVPTLDTVLVAPCPLGLQTGDSQALSVVAGFSNGDSFDLSGREVSGLLYEPNAAGIITVNAQGDVTAVGSGTTDLRVTLSTNGRTLTTAVPVFVDVAFLSLSPQTLTVRPGQSSSTPVVATFTDAVGQTTNVTGQTSFVSNSPDVSITAAGIVAVADSAVPGDIVTLSGSFTDDQDQLFSASADLTVGSLVASGIVATPSRVTLPVGGVRYAPVITSSDDGLPVDLDDYDFLTSNAEAATVDGGVISSGATPGAAIITVSDKNSPNIFAEVQVTTVNANITGVSSTADSFSMYVSQGVDIVVEASLSNGDTMVAAQNSPDLDVLVGQQTAALVDRQLVALETTGLPPTTTAVEIGFASGSRQTLGLTVREVQLTGTDLMLGGLSSGDAGYGSLPQGQYGVVQLDGLFEDGSRRPLRVNDEYTASSSNDAGVPFTVRTGKWNGRLDGRVGSAGNTTTTLAIELADAIDGDLDVDAGPDLTLNVQLTDGSSIVGNARLAYENYPDDISVLAYNTATFPESVERTLELRADFPGVPNFRIGSDNVIPVCEPPTVPPGSPGTQFEIRCSDFSESTVTEWLRGGCLVANEFGQLTLGADVRCLLRVVDATGPSPLTTLGRSNEITFKNVIPTSVTVVPGSGSTEVGRRISFQTLVDYGDGRGPLVRTLDYPVSESTLDTADDVWAVFNTAAESSIFFFKKTSASHGSDFRFRAVSEATLLPLSDLSVGVLDIVVEVVRRL
jgi:hypothetical protein